MTTVVPASDGARLAVHEWGRPAAPTVLCVHGFPDDHTGWDGVAVQVLAPERDIAGRVRAFVAGEA